MVDTSFLLTLTIIFLVALLGSYLSGRRRDSCLRDFDGYHVTVEKKGGRIIWGNLHLFASGVEFEYKTNVQDQAHVETSYLLYKEEYKDVQAFYRYADELTAANQLEREKNLRRSFHPGFGRVLSRKLRNFVNTAGDSLAEAIGFVTGQARQKQSTEALSETGETYLKKLGKDIIGHVGSTFDPLLEEYVGAKVVVEILEGEAIHEYVGILKEYSAEFLEILDVLYPETLSLNLASEEDSAKLAEDIDVTFDGVFHVHNLTDYPLLLHEIKCGDRQGRVNAVIGPGDTINLQPLALTEARTAGRDEQLSVFFEGLSDDEEQAIEAEADEGPVSEEGEQSDLAEMLANLADFCGTNGDVRFDFKIIRMLDMVVPRAHALIRHKAERYDPDQVFGSLEFSLPFLDKEDDLEQAYREAVDGDSEDAASALALAKILIRQAEYEEAAQMLELALEHRNQLVDQGRLAALELQFVRKKLASRRGKVAA